MIKTGSVIAAVKGREAFDRALDSPVSVIFLLGGDILTVGKYASDARAAGKKLYLHMDLIEGMGRDEAAIRYVAEAVRPEGIISTKASVVKWAKAAGLRTVFRIFIVDSQSRKTAGSNIGGLKADAVEIMPGIMPEVIRDFAASGSATYIAGGLVSTSEQVTAALRAGAAAVSTSAEQLWKMA